MKTSEQVNEIFAALALAQGQVQGAHKDSQNPHYRSNYADLESCWDACRAALSASGIAVHQDVITSQDAVAVVTTLGHGSGQYIESSPLAVPMAKYDAHGVGSAETYARRYSLCASVGIAPTDDDGNAAIGRPTEPQRRDDRPRQETRQEPRREPPKPAPRQEAKPAPKAEAPPVAPKPASEPPPADPTDPGPASEPKAERIEQARAIVNGGGKPSAASAKQITDLKAALRWDRNQCNALCLQVTGTDGTGLTEAGAQLMITAMEAAFESQINGEAGR